MTINATVREKTAGILNNKVAENTLRNAIQNCGNIDEKQMRDLIWRLTYQPKEGSEELGFKGLNEPAVRAVRGELVYFYKAIRKDWQYGATYKPRTAAEKKLWKAVKGDPYTFDRVMWKIRQHASWQGAMIEKIVRCLNSQKENQQFGGLRQLGFRYEEAVFLKPVANAAGEVLEEQIASWQAKQQEKKQEEQQS